MLESSTQEERLQMQREASVRFINELVADYRGRLVKAAKFLSREELEGYQEMLSMIQNTGKSIDPANIDQESLYQELRKNIDQEISLLP